MVEDLNRIARELYKWRIVNKVDEVRVFSMEDSSYDYSAYATKNGGIEVDVRRTRDGRDDG